MAKKLCEEVEKLVLTDEQFKELKDILNDQLTSKNKIMKRMNIGEERFYLWLEMGAPISCEENGGTYPRFSADRKQLQEWCVQQFPWRKSA